MTRHAVVAALLLAAGCARAPAQDAGPAAPVITLARGACFGRCPVYSLAIQADGTVQYRGERFVRVSGVATARVSRDTVRALLARFEQGGYLDLADRYAPGDPTCTRFVTDLPTVTTSATIGGRTKRVEHSHGCVNAPAILKQLERAIDEAAQVERWTGVATQR